MNDGCRCEYLSEECGGADVVCQHCYDKAKEEITKLREAVTLLDRVFGVWMSDNTGHDFIDALDPVMHDAEKWLKEYTANMNDEVRP